MQLLLMAGMMLRMVVIRLLLEVSHIMGRHCMLTGRREHTNIKVHYVDLLKEKADDVQFLSHREKNIAYGSYASGADIGDSKEDGAYYTGYTLDSTTKEKVIKENITVYRYFIKSTYQVRYIDQVIEGKKSGTILQSVKKVKEYQEIANGAELGTDTKKAQIL